MLEIVDEAPAGFIPRKEAAKLLYVVVSRISQLVRDDTLKGVLVRGKHEKITLYVSAIDVEARRAEALEKLHVKSGPKVGGPAIHQSDARYVDGPTTARAFKLFRAGKTFHDAVVELKLTPEQATYVWHAFRDGPGVIEAERRRTKNEQLIKLAARR